MCFMACFYVKKLHHCDHAFLVLSSRMPFYHALFRNDHATKDDAQPGYWTSGGEYNGMFNEEFARDRLQSGMDAELVVIHFFKSESELLRFHQEGSWKNYMK